MENAPGTAQHRARVHVVHRSEARAPQTTAFGQTAAALFTGPMNWLEKYILVLVLAGLFSGIAIASVSQAVVDQVDSVINVFMDLYESAVESQEVV